MTSTNRTNDRMQRLKDLLEMETFPLNYTHKFIGVKSAEFEKCVDELEERFPQLSRVAERESKAGTESGEALYIALTYEFIASDPQEVIEILEATAELKGLKIIL